MPIIRLAQAMHIISAAWVLLLAVVIFIDVMGRTLFSSPLPGTKEIIQNSVVAIAFLQLPFAVYAGSMLRTSIIADALSPSARRVLRTIAFALGAVFFLFLSVSAWGPFLQGWRIGEYEGEGAFRVATWPVRGVLVATSVFCAVAYTMMIIYDWRDQLAGEQAAPGLD